MLLHHLAELRASGIPDDLPAANVRSFGAGTECHWKDELSELLAYARSAIQTGSITASGHPQSQPGHLATRLSRPDNRYRHLQLGGWSTLSEALLGFHDGGGLLLPRIPDTYWRRICERQGLPFPDAAARSGGFWLSLATPGLQLLICEGWKKALAAVACGWAAVATPGVQMGRRRAADGRERLIEALQLLNASGRRWLIAFDAEAKRSTAAKVGSAAGCLARCLCAAGGRPEVAWLPLLSRGAQPAGWLSGRSR